MRSDATCFLSAFDIPNIIHTLYMLPLDGSYYLLANYTVREVKYPVNTPEFKIVLYWAMPNVTKVKIALEHF